MKIINDIGTAIFVIFLASVGIWIGYEFYKHKKIEVPQIKCGEKREGNRIEPVFPILGMDFSELPKALKIVEKVIGHEKIIMIAPHNSECLYIKTGRQLGRLNGTGKSYYFQKTKGIWTLIYESSWIS